MSRKRVSIRKIKEVLRLKLFVDRSRRQISKKCGIARSTVADYLNRAASAGLSWPLPEDMNEAKLGKMLYPPLPVIAPENRSKPAWSKIYKELKRKSVSSQLLWQEYKEDNPDGYQYSRFCQLYRSWLGTQNVVMRQNHKASENIFVDYAGQQVSVINRSTGEVRSSEIFVAVLGASSYTYAEATRSQSLSDWIISHIRTFNFLGGCPLLLIPDNLKSGVTKAHRLTQVNSYNSSSNFLRQRYVNLFPGGNMFPITPRKRLSLAFSCGDNSSMHLTSLSVKFTNIVLLLN